MQVSLTPQFRRQFRKLPQTLREEAFEKIELFKDTEAHTRLKVHKLHGKFKNYYSFSVNYQYRVVFMWEVQNKSAILLAIGDHAAYD